MKLNSDECMTWYGSLDLTVSISSSSLHLHAECTEFARSSRSQIDTPHALNDCKHSAMEVVCQLLGCANSSASNNWHTLSPATILVLPKRLASVYNNIFKDGESRNSLRSPSCLNCMYLGTRLRLPHLWDPFEATHAKQALKEVLWKSQDLHPKRDGEPHVKALFIWLRQRNQASMAKRSSRLFEVLPWNGQTETHRVQIQRR